jgi:hypothetical protein
LDSVNHRAAEFTEGLQDTLALGDVAAVAGDNRDQRSAIRRMQERGIGSKFLGRGFDEVTEVADDIDGGGARVEEKAAQDSVYRVGLEFERRDNSEVPASAAESPEQIFVLRSTGGEDSAIGGDYLARQ